MAKCVVHFDQIEIISKKSDPTHADNDWLIVHWFVGGGGLKQSHTIPLTNGSGSNILQSGQTLQPVSLEVSCVDTDLVTAVFQVVNLGSSDPAEQVVAITKIAQKGAEIYAEAYTTAAAFVVKNSGIPLGQVFGAAIDQFKDAFVATVTTAFEDIIIPFFSDVAEFVSGILGKPNCNGDVLHDVAVFTPAQPVPSQTISKTYTGDARSGCGTARTLVRLTLERVLEVVPIFPNTPLPKVDIVPTPGESPDNWLGLWANDPLTPTPLILVTISRSTAASGTYAVTVLEHVDQRFNATFEAQDAIEMPESVILPYYAGNVFGTIKPWLSGAMSPGNLTTMLSAVAGNVQTMALSASGARVSALAAPPAVMLSPSSFPGVIPGTAAPALAFTFAWERPKNPILTRPSHGPVRAGSTSFPGLYGFEGSDAFVLEWQGVTLGLYKFVVGSSPIGPCVRYRREANASFTHADVVLTPWKPVK